MSSWSICPILVQVFRQPALGKHRPHHIGHLRRTDNFTAAFDNSIFEIRGKVVNAELGNGLGHIAQA